MSGGLPEKKKMKKEKKGYDHKLKSIKPILFHFSIPTPKGT